MKVNSRNINRRSFVGRTGKMAAGFTLLPGSVLIDQAAMSLPVQINSQYTVGELKNSPELPADNSISSIPDLKWWEREPLRIVELEEGFEFREKAELLNGLGANMEHLTRFTDTSPGTSFLDAHNLFKGRKVNFESLKEYLTEAHRNNIKVVIYYNVHAIEIKYARSHPEWQQIKEDGKPIEDVYSIDSSFCINSPWREEVFGTLRKMAAFDIDGVFYDGPIFFSTTCRCEACKRQFRQRFLKDMPSKVELSSSHSTISKGVK
jgi:hypothetical protein